MSPVTGQTTAAVAGGGASDGANGAAAQALGIAREQAVANQVGGKVSNEIVITSRGKTDIDVIGPNGELIGVGGPNKAENLGNLGNEIAKLQEVASQRGVVVQYYITQDTPASVYDFLAARIGANNVFFLKGK